MGESSSACLVRSFSQPSQERFESEGDTLGALTSSVSFGRFMSESLEWEKWSAFTSNRYLEDVKKYSRPGSVAEKKAYFEAHFKKKATKKASPLLEQQNFAVVCESSDQNNDPSVVNMEEDGDLNVRNQTIDDSQISESEFTENSSHVGNRENNLEAAETENSPKQSNPTENEAKSLNIEGSKREEANLTLTNQTVDDSHITESDFTEKSSCGVTEEAQEEKVHRIKHSEVPESSSHVGNGENNLEAAETENSPKQYNPIENEVKSLNQLEECENIGKLERVIENAVKPLDQPEDVLVVVENIVIQTKNAAIAGDSVLQRKKKPLPFTTRLTSKNYESSKIRSRVKATTSQQPKVTDKCTSTSKRNIAKLKEKTQTKNAAMAGDSVLPMKKKPLSVTSRLTNNDESSKVRSFVKTEKAQQLKVSDNSASTSRKNATKAGDSMVSMKKKPLPLTTGLTNDHRCASTSRKNGKGSIDTKQLNPKSCHTSITMKQALSPILEKIVSSRLVRSITKTSRDSKVQQNPALVTVSGIPKCPPLPKTPQREDKRNFKSTNKQGSKGCSSRTVVSPFSLRSAERAAKRREFFQKLEQKRNAKEANKEKLQVKPKIQTSRAKPDASIHPERDHSSYQVKTMVKQPCSPKLSRKPVLEVHENKPRQQPWRLSGKHDGSKDVKGESKLSNHSSLVVQSHNPKSVINRRSTQENTSPNIQSSIQTKAVGSQY